jgi:hypothetical protein
MIRRSTRRRKRRRSLRWTRREVRKDAGYCNGSKLTPEGCSGDMIISFWSFHQGGHEVQLCRQRRSPRETFGS